MLIPDTYHARRARKVRLIAGVGFFLLALFAVPTALAWILRIVTPPVTFRTLQDDYLSALSYPDPHPDQTDLLVFTRHGSQVTISTCWLPLTPATAGVTPPDAIYICFETIIEGSTRARPTDAARLHIAVTGNARLPADATETSLVFNANRSFTLTTTPRLRSQAARFQALPPPLHDPVLFLIPTDAILVLLTPHNAPPAVTIGPLTLYLTNTHLTPLRALAATLKPGYTPPTEP